MVSRDFEGVMERENVSATIHNEHETMPRARILVVEDEMIVAMELQRRLKRLEYVVPAVVASGEEGIKKVAETHPDLVLMDIMLRGAMDGIEAAEQIRERFNIPVVYLTAYSDDETLQRAKITAPFGYILKPFSERELCTTIEIALYRHRVEEELRQHRDHLGELVKERTAELTRANEQLRQEMAERKRMEEHIVRQERLAAVGQLAAGIAHDFNNLLTGIIGYAQLLEMREDVPESAKKDLKRIEREGGRAAHLIRQILDFSRKSIIQRQPLELVAFLGETIKFLQRTIPENTHIVLATSYGEYSVNADPAQMQQILTNLAVNARDAMPEGGELRFQLSRFTLVPGEPPPCPGMSPGEWIELSVSDTGTGIATEHVPRIFEPFFTTKEVREGTGLGLAQVYGIVMQHDGFIDVESELGKGTTFLIYLSALGGGEEVSEEKAPEEIRRGRGETILVVEDDPMVLEMVGKMLEELGCCVLTAGNGEEALSVYDQHGEDILLVLTDMVMPGVDGMELFYALREQNSQVKVVVMTGYPLKDAEGELLSQGIVAWVQKPIDFGKLTQVMAKVFP